MCLVAYPLSLLRVCTQVEAGPRKGELGFVQVDGQEQTTAVKWYDNSDRTVAGLHSLRWYVYFDAPVRARYVKIHLVGYMNYPSMRAGVLVESGHLDPADWAGKTIVAYKK